MTTNLTSLFGPDFVLRKRGQRNHYRRNVLDHSHLLGTDLGPLEPAIPAIADCNHYRWLNASYTHQEVSLAGVFLTRSLFAIVGQTPPQMAIRLNHWERACLIGNDAIRGEVMIDELTDELYTVLAFILEDRYADHGLRRWPDLSILANAMENLVYRPIQRTLVLAYMMYTLAVIEPFLYVPVKSLRETQRDLYLHAGMASAIIRGREIPPLRNGMNQHLLMPNGLLLPALSQSFYEAYSAVDGPTASSPHLMAWNDRTIPRMAWGIMSGTSPLEATVILADALQEADPACLRHQQSDQDRLRRGLRHRGDYLLRHLGPLSYREVV